MLSQYIGERPSRIPDHRLDEIKEIFALAVEDFKRLAAIGRFRQGGSLRCGL